MDVLCTVFDFISRLDIPFFITIITGKCASEKELYLRDEVKQSCR